MTGNAPLADPGGAAGPTVGGVDAAGPARRLWRSVYRKAGEVAQAAAAQLVKEHVYLFHRTAAAPGGGGGGGAGDWVLLASHTVAGAEASIDFSGISQEYTTLVAIGDNLHLEASTQPVCFQLNAWGGNDYLETVHRHAYPSTHDLVFPTADNAGSIGYAPKGDDDDLDAVAAFTLWLPGYAATGRYHSYYGQASLAREDGNAAGYEVAGHVRMEFADHEHVDQLTFYAGYSPGGSPFDLFLPESRICLYGVRGPGAALGAPGSGGARRMGGP